MKWILFTVFLAFCIENAVVDAIFGGLTEGLKDSAKTLGDAAYAEAKSIAFGEEKKEEGGGQSKAVSTVRLQKYR